MRKSYHKTRYRFTSIKFKQENGEVKQYFAEDEDYNFEILKIEKESQIESFAKEQVNTRFNIFGSRLFEFKLFKLPSGYGGFITNIHHIISDAATFSILSTEIVDNYYKLINNEEIPTKPYSYLDYINSEKEYLKSNRFEKDKVFWEEYLNPLPEPATFVPTISENTEDHKATRKSFTIDSILLDKIKKYCMKNNVSIYNFLISVYSIYLGRVNNLEEFTIRNTNFE